MPTWLPQAVKDAMEFVAGAQGPGLESTTSNSRPWAPWVTIVLLVAVAVYVVAIYLRERGSAGRAMKLLLAAIRVSLVALLLFMLYGWMLHRHRTDLPDLVVMIDDSESMSFADRLEDSPRQLLVERLKAVGLDEATRMNLAKLLLLENNGDWLTRMQERYNLKVFVVGGSARVPTSESGQARGTDATDETNGTDESVREAVPQKALREVIAELDARQPVSRLGKGVRDVLQAQRGRPTAAIVLLTDGVTTEGKTVGEVAEYARRKAVPMYVVGLGQDRSPRDIRAGDLLVDEIAFVDDQVNFDFKVTAAGYAGQRVAVRLKQKGATPGVVAEQQITLGEDGAPLPVRLSHRPQKTGDFEYVVEVAAQAGEADPNNNTVARIVKVRDETIRVLLVEEFPTYEFRFLKRLLGRELKRGGKEKSIELATILQDADLEYTEQDETAERVFPVSREELFKYDVLIFGDASPSYFSRSVMDNIAAFVEERGGGVVFLAGPRHMPLGYRDTPLARLLPIDPNTAIAPPPDAVLDQPFTVVPTRLGLTSPQMQLAENTAANLQIWRTLPEIYWVLDTPDLRPGARVLAEEPTRTTTTGMNLPLISVQFVGAGKVIFHAFDESYRWSRHQDGEQYFARYWIQTIRYLSRAKLLGESRTAELSSDREEYRRGDSVRLRVRFLDDRLAPPQDDGVTIMLEKDGGRRHQVTLHRDAANRGLFEGTIGNLTDGRYRAWVATPTLAGQPPSQRFTVVAPPGEQARLEMDSADLKLAAKTSQGKFYTFDTAGSLLDDLPHGRQVRIESLPPTPIWNSPLLAGLFVALIAAEWLLRKRVGLL